MCGVAVSASRGNKQTALDEAFSVDAVEIAVNNTGLALDTRRSLPALFMTGSTQKGNVAYERRRYRHVLAHDSMFRMTIDAGRGIGITPLDELAMHAAFEHVNLIGMADRAVDSCARCLAGSSQRRRNVCMALSAGRACMCRGGIVDLVYIERNELAIALHDQIRI